MLVPDSKPTRPSPLLLGLYNAVPNVLWSALSLVPLCLFCYQHVERPWLYGFLVVSLLGYALPVSRFRHFQLSPRAATYQRLGVPALNRFTQHGDIINELIRRKYPQYRHVRTRAALASFARATYYQEQFHLVMFVFFLLVSGYALVHGYLGWAALLVFLNILYNVYPMWLQQYLRIRLARAPKSAR
ncbi:glycosyl-4,4'-diaponeurosporenoate acyltransferase CrtO family protein [Hymenobacter crusticola]|uniref:Glycosyl-4,4'-diaponeurosporenoate acyltransferase n=1 Tax=Hymenobacter crusticola TaxID=1770526 RepID=A0A243WJN3_9BACT|nr:hypothetical protein [Hymenobacter crusticola]OUJ76098.1 hypothetical protein BXP70_02140 [Hymenobacter crusticola]